MMNANKNPVWEFYHVVESGMQVNWKIYQRLRWKPDADLRLMRSEESGNSFFAISSLMKV
jgi:hypothetical protein